MIFIVFIMKYIYETKPPMNGIFTPSIGGFAKFKAQSLNLKAKSKFTKLCIMLCELCIYP